MFSLLTLSYPYDDCNGDNDSTSRYDSDYDIETAESRLEELIGTRPTLPDHIVGQSDCCLELIELFTACTEEDYTQRPSSRLIYQCLSDFLP